MCGIPTKQCLMKTRVPAASNHSLCTESKHINLYSWISYMSVVHSDVLPDPGGQFRWWVCDGGL